jgi:hypothetical protein
MTAHPGVDFFARPNSDDSEAQTDVFDGFLNKLPEWPEARRLCNIFLKYRHWGINALGFVRLNYALLPQFYDEAKQPQIEATAAPATSGDDTGEKPRVHALALLLTVLAIGSLLDVSMKFEEARENAKRFFDSAYSLVNQLGPFCKWHSSLRMVHF